MSFRKMLAVAMLPLALAGCADSGWNPFAARQRVVEYPPYEGEGYTEREPTEREKLLARADFSVEMVRFADARRPRSTALATPEGNIYDYEPDELLQGVTYKVPVLVNKYLAWRPKTEKHYRVEMELEQLHARIISGNLWSGNMGRYATDVEARVMVRRPDSQVVLNKVYTAVLEQKRPTFNGRNPSKEMDRARVYDLVEDAFRAIAEDIAWDIRQQDARKWKVDTSVPAAHMRPVKRTIQTEVPEDLPPKGLADEGELDTIETLMKPEDPSASAPAEVPGYDPSAPGVKG
jgi:hypothetical protein